MAVSYEKRDVKRAGVLWGGVAIVAVVAVAFALMWPLLGVLVEGERAASAPQHPLAGKLGRTAPPQPTLQTSPRQDLLNQRAKEDAILESYAWVDEGQGLVRIPIERAMELVAKRGLPARPGASR
jgi:hypothetical protein